MKPNTTAAMRELISQVRSTMPFHLPASQLCAGPCRGCPKKLLEFLDQELEEWETRLDAGEKPTLGDVSRFGKMCRRIHAALASNKLV
ncbi:MULTISPECIES: hypothetical protein [unclassified Microbulbifer]|uniref:hypothetical protein n=1 Tax=unclassified Microbulbifer TaxID=2619833 RepID=UPI0027E48D22|nr:MULTISPECIES: hypothetical protein [unclassified Microbulbifer]